MKNLIGGALIAAALAAATQAPIASAYSGDTVDQFTAAVDSMASRYNTGHIPVFVDHFDDDQVIARSDGYKITLNSTWAALSPGRFNALIADDVASGYTPGGCAGIQGTAIHEVGHVIDRQGGRAARSAVANSGQISGLHGYAYDSGTLNPGEAVAISFQAVECGSATSTERGIYNLMFS